MVAPGTTAPEGSVTVPRTSETPSAKPSSCSILTASALFMARVARVAVAPASGDPGAICGEAAGGAGGAGAPLVCACCIAPEDASDAAPGPAEKAGAAGCEG